MSDPFLLKQKRDRHVGFMDHAKLLDLSQCVVRGPRLGQHLGPFFDASSSNAKERPLLVAWQRTAEHLEDGDGIISVTRFCDW